ncbi:hypothetical protein SUGI_0055780 [Cryptomeria japonica]|nr:hypothetical protein SUGI_0055780 [Cryptomeria japonica]
MGSSCDGLLGCPSFCFFFCCAWVWRVAAVEVGVQVFQWLRRCLPRGVWVSLVLGFVEVHWDSVLEQWPCSFGAFHCGLFSLFFSVRMVEMGVSNSLVVAGVGPPHGSFTGLHSLYVGARSRRDLN